METRDFVGIRKGLDGQSLGELEAQIMDIVWTFDTPVTTAQVFKVMYAKRELSYSTIMLTMSKLAKKGILNQTRTGEKKTDAFVYVPLMTRQEMGLALLNSVSQTILGTNLGEALPTLWGDEVKSANQASKKIMELVGATTTEE